MQIIHIEEKLEDCVKTTVKVYVFCCKNEWFQQSTTSVVRCACILICNLSLASGATGTQSGGLSGTMVETITQLACT